MEKIGLSVAAVLLLAGTICSAADYIDQEQAREHPGFDLLGEYFGSVERDEGRTALGLQMSVYGDREFRGMIYEGGLPGDGWTPEDGGASEVRASVAEPGDELEIEHAGLTLRSEPGRFVAVDEDGQERGRLLRVERKSPTLGKAPPEDAVVLFDGTDLSHWDDETSMTEDGLLKEGATTAEAYGDIHLHLEYKQAFMPDAGDQGRANSGVYIQNRYEVQILDTFGWPATENGAASLYNFRAPELNMSYPPLRWQTYDIEFRAPRFDEAGEKTENARVTVYHNGVLVHDDVEMTEGGTGAGGQRPEVEVAELYLQDHSDPVRFRNVWLVEGGMDD